MNKVSLAFFSGSLVPAIAIFALGGTSRACLFAGAFLVIVPALLFARKVAGWLCWVADAVDAVRGVSVRPGPQLVRSVPAKQSKSTVDTSPEAKQLETALINLGLDKKEAVLIVQKTGPGTFEARFKEAVNLARRVA